MMCGRVPWTGHGAIIFTMSVSASPESVEGNVAITVHPELRPVLSRLDELDFRVAALEAHTPGQTTSASQAAIQRMQERWSALDPELRAMYDDAMDQALAESRRQRVAD